ncbi:MAG: elongation factor EF-2 [archaeon]
MARKEDLIAKVKELMWKPDKIRNIGIIAHIDHGKTTLSDSLVAGSGMISEEHAGKQLFMDFDEQEQARGITINAANVSLLHEVDGVEYLINMIDTPGHVDFGGDVIRAMRAVDGGVVVVCAVEGAMPQTETVLRQAMRERVRPILFINKVDRLIREIKLTPEEMQKRFVKIIARVNELIRKNCTPELYEQFKVGVDDGSVMFGSAFHKWALSLPHMKKLGLGFKDILDSYASEEWQNLYKKAPLHKILLDMVVKHHPSPKQAQIYRIPQIWPGDDKEMEAKLAECNSEGPLALMVTKMIIDPQAGDVATGRLFSGTLYDGAEVHLCNIGQNFRTQQVGIYMGPERSKIEKVPAGNIIAVMGLKSARSGETVCDPNNPIEPFEAIHEAEPVVTEAIEAKNTADLPKLVEVLRNIEKEDPAIKIELDEATGEHKMSGQGELHLEIWRYRIEHDKKIPITHSDPIVVYRETIDKASPEVEGKSPNRHNKFYITVEPLEQPLQTAIFQGKLAQGKVKKKEYLAEFQELGLDKNEAKGVADICGQNMLISMVKGEVHLTEIMELAIEAFEVVMKRGPLCDESCAGVKVKLHDTKLHEDAIHRGPAQVIPAVRSAIKGAMLTAGVRLLEPKQTLFIRVPDEHMGAVNKEMQSRRGQILDMQQEGDSTEITAKAPVAELFGFSNDIRSATEGRVLWSTENAGFEQLPQEIQMKVVKEIRQRKGLKEDLPKPSDYLE